VCGRVRAPPMSESPTHAKFLECSPFQMPPVLPICAAPKSQSCLGCSLPHSTQQSPCGSAQPVAKSSVGLQLWSWQEAAVGEEKAELQLPKACTSRLATAAVDWCCCPLQHSCLYIVASPLLEQPVWWAVGQSCQELATLPEGGAGG